MPAKKATPAAPRTCTTGAMKWVWGIITILLGISLWMSYLSLEQFFAIVFVLIGLKRLCGFYHHC
jgi:hypothetical protein